MPHYIIIKGGCQYYAYNDHGRLCAVDSQYQSLSNRMANIGYCQVSLNSRLGRTIYDLLPTFIRETIEKKW